MTNQRAVKPWRFELSGRVQLLLLLLITGLAAALRFYKLGDWSFWIDEIYSLDRGQSFMAGGRWSNLTEALIGMMVTYGANNEWTARLPSVVIGIISVPLLYLPVRTLFGPAVALLTSLLLAVSPWHLYWSQNARFYVLVMLFYTLGLLTFFIGLEQNRTRYVALGMVLMTAAVFERLNSFLFLPVVVTFLAAVLLLRFERPAGYRWQHLVWLLLPIVAFLAYELFWQLGHAATNHATSFDTSPKRPPIEQFITTFFVGQAFFNPAWLQASIVSLIGLPVFCLALVMGGYWLLAERDRLGLFILLGAAVPFAILFVISWLFYTQERYIFASFPFWLMLAALAVKKLFEQTEGAGQVLAVGVLAIVVITPLAQSGMYFKYQNGYRSDWKGAFELIQARKADTDLVAANYPEMGIYYLQQDVLNRDELKPEDIAAHGGRLWLVQGMWQPAPMPPWFQQHSRLVEVLDVTVPLKKLYMQVYLYDPNQ